MNLSSLKLIFGKFTFISASIVLLNFSIASAQNFYLGVRGGPLLGWQSFGDKYDKKTFEKVPPVFGYYGGGVVGFPLNKNYTFQAEAGFSQKGRKLVYSTSEGGAHIEHKATYHFIDLSMMLRKDFPLRINKNIPYRCFFNVGPNINYWLSGKGVIQDRYEYDVVFHKKNDGNFKNMYLTDINRWLFGIDFGVGFAAPLRNNTRLITELRFTSGHTFYGPRDNNKSIEILNFEDNLRANQKVLSLTVTYVLDLNVQKLKTGHSTKDKEIKRKGGNKKKAKRRR
jgi:hypothetical protein